MLAKDIHVGGTYIAKVSGNLVAVRVDEIDTDVLVGYRGQGKNKYGTRYHVTNMQTLRKLTFRSAAKFRTIAKIQAVQPAPTQANHRSPFGI